MIRYRLFLAFIIATLALYTFPVVLEFGIIVLLPNFFGEIGKMNWQGQFNLDFLMFLLMSGFWIAWRNNFTPKGITLGVGGVFLGAPYLAAYLLYLSFQFGGDVEKVLVGERRK